VKKKWGSNIFVENMTTNYFYKIDIKNKENFLKQEYKYH